MTGFGGGSDGEAQTKRPFLSAGRTATFGAHGWKTLKHGLKLLGQRKEEHKIDYLKSAELMAELRAGAPAALMLASMIQRDEHGNKRIPVLLEQLKLQITDSRTLDDKGNESERHLVFRIELEYGSGLNRMKWVINIGGPAVLQVGVGARLAAMAVSVIDRALTRRPWIVIGILPDGFSTPKRTSAIAAPPTDPGRPAWTTAAGPPSSVRMGTGWEPRRTTTTGTPVATTASNNVRCAPASSTVERSLCFSDHRVPDQPGLVAEDDDRHVGAQSRRQRLRGFPASRDR